ncbi:hypothetical protein L9F63_023282, partial [Diploptera punctata]
VTLMHREWGDLSLRQEDLFHSALQNTIQSKCGEPLNNLKSVKFNLTPLTIIFNCSLRTFNYRFMLKVIDIFAQNILEKGVWNVNSTVRQQPVPSLVRQQPVPSRYERTLFTRLTPYFGDT